MCVTAHSLPGPALGAHPSPSVTQCSPPLEGINTAKGRAHGTSPEMERHVPIVI